MSAPLRSRFPDPVGEVRAALEASAGELWADGRLSGMKLERPRRADLGDYSTNAPMLLAPALREPPRDVAERLAELVRGRLGEDLDRAEVAGPGFLNLVMADSWCRRALSGLLAAGDEFGGGGAASVETILVEFVSANPTGPITVASGRHAAFGDALCRLLAFHGHEVTREYYVNDFGSQVQRFGESIRARARGEEPPEGGYLGAYVTKLARRIPGAAERDVDELTRLGVEEMLAGVRESLTRFRVEMDAFFSERSLHAAGAIDGALKRLAERGRTYEHDGAVWLRTTESGDDKDRVLTRSTGEETYFAADIAYHEEKRARGFDRLIDVWGADHHGYVSRMLAAWESLGGEPGRLELLIMQLVNLLEGGRRVQFSKRQGEFVTLDDLVDDIGVDAARFFLLERSHETTLDLDLDLARNQSQDNPVYYVQYAHARIASILRRAGEERVAAALASPHTERDEELHPSARGLLKRLLEFPTEIAVAAERRSPHRLTTYAHEVGQDFSAFYRDVRIFEADELGQDGDFRLSLCVATRRVIARSLDLLGVSAPDRM